MSPPSHSSLCVSPERSCPRPQHLSSSRNSTQWVAETKEQTTGREQNPQSAVPAVLEQDRHHRLAKGHREMLDVGSAQPDCDGAAHRVCWVGCEGIRVCYICVKVDGIVQKEGKERY